MGPHRRALVPAGTWELGANVQVENADGPAFWPVVAFDYSSELSSGEAVVCVPWTGMLVPISKLAEVERVESVHGVVPMERVRAVEREQASRRRTLTVPNGG
jgi:hypothetical protein